MTTLRPDILIVGAGPAGLSAALAARQAGATVHVIDQFPTAGGQYWMQPPSVAAEQKTTQSAEGAAAIAAMRAAGAVCHLGTEVWGAFPDLTICAVQNGEPLVFAPRALIVATGAHDRVIPFPGWTLPGVMTAGAGQRLAKTSGVAAGSRIVLAGSGAFLLAVRGAIAKAGADIIAHVEARGPSLAIARLLLGHPERWGEAWKLMRPLLARRETLRLGHIVTEALGQDRVEAARIAPIASDGEIDRRRSQTIGGIDALLVGYGFRPSIELTSLLRCKHAFDDARGGWYCEIDRATGRTSVAGVYAAGEITGIAGSMPARLAGEIAGLAAAADLGFAAHTDRADLLRRLARARGFAEGLNAAFAPMPAFDTLATDATLLCRCEEVTKGEVMAAMQSGASSAYAAKLWTRACMGRCQGRICGWGIAHIMAAATGRDPAELGVNQPRIPIRPVPIEIAATALDPGRDAAA
ncbi:NAD(P)/FAD-dependent oxidoreductase [Kaistia adipata]|uniref:FAD/NAD(P)-dependent oxidoreductase n=1 Tax=Kaistia adipata TaxID=166954 RepID=UPI00041FD7D9|nr:NAD(P)/FAD-dependent oxidoreductase [Kaistia adipata]